MELSPLHACKHDNGPWFINKAISISIISGKIAAKNNKQNANINLPTARRT
jgi:hypothetical protein